MPRRLRVGTSGLPSWVTNIAAGTKADISLNLFTDVTPSPVPEVIRGVSGPSAAFWWSGTTYAPELGTYGSFLQTCSGHNAYYGNEVYRYDIETRLWSRITEPYLNIVIGPNGYYCDSNGESWTDTAGSGTVQSQPGSFQSYDKNFYLPPNIAGAGSAGALVTPIRVAMSPQGSLHGNRSHILQLNGTPIWSRYSGNTVNVNHTAFGTNAYARQRNMVYMANWDGGNTLATLDLTTQTWSTLTLSAGVAQGAVSNMRYMESLDLLFLYRWVSGVQTMWVCDPDTGTIYSPGTPTGTVPVHNGSSTTPSGGGEWVESLGKFYYYMGDGSNDVYIMTPSSSPTTQPWTFVKQTLTGAASAPQHANPQHQSRFRYIPSLGIFLWVAGAPNAVQAWKLA